LRSFCSSGLSLCVSSFALVSFFSYFLASGSAGQGTAAMDADCCWVSLASVPLFLCYGLPMLPSSPSCLPLFLFYSPCTHFFSLLFLCFSSSFFFSALICTLFSSAFIGQRRPCAGNGRLDDSMQRDDSRATCPITEANLRFCFCNVSRPLLHETSSEEDGEQCSRKRHRFQI